MRKHRVLAAAGLVLALAVLPSAAQSTGGLKVRVVDEDKMGFPGVVVTLSNTKQLVATTNVVTDAQGVAHFPVLRPGGDYVVSAFVPGYARVTLPGLRVKSSETTEVPIALTPEDQLVTTVEVTVDRQVVDLEDNSSVSRYSEEFIRDLPVQGRFYQNVLTLAPGVQDDDGDGNPNVHGARERDFKASVGGVSNQDPLTGGWLNQVNFDSIEEVEVITAGAGAEYGRAQGGFANIIQKQGSNDFEGTFNLLYRSRRLDGNGASNIPTSRLGDFESFRPAVSLSGPIVKDKLWYRLDHEYRRDDTPVNTGTEIISQPLRQTINDDQITWQVSDRNKLSFQYQSDPLERNNLGVSSFTPPESAFYLNQGGPTYKLTWSAPYSPKIFVESVVSFQDFELEFGPSVAGAPNVCQFPSVFAGLNDSRCADLDSGQQSGSYPSQWNDARQRLTVKSDATFFIGNFLGMSHEVKTGITVENERYYRRLQQGTQSAYGRYFSINENSDELNPVVIVVANVPVEPVSADRATGTTWSAYATDTFKPLSNLSLTVGVRLDREEINAPGFTFFDPKEEYDAYVNSLIPGAPFIPAVYYNAFTAYENLAGLETALNQQIAGDPNGPIALTGGLATATNWTNTRRRSDIRLRNTNLAPRLAVSWDPWNNGKQKFALTAGRFYDKIFLAVPLVESEAPNVNAQFLMDETSNGLVSRGTAVNPVLSYSMIDRGLKTPYSDEITVSFEREIFTETSFKISYIKRNFKNQLQDLDLNRLPFDFGRCVVPTTSNPGRTVVASPGTGQIVDPWTGVTYQDTDPGDGDGRMDDCSGNFIPIEGPPPFPGQPNQTILLSGPDGITDLYGVNPGWGSVYLVGNYNSAKYDAVVLELVRRQYKDWQMEASYTWSRALGDAEDWNTFLGDDRTTLEDEYGYLSYDRTHQVKLNATRLLRGGWRLGTAATWQSGLPWSILRQDFSQVTYAPAVAAEGTPSSLTRIRYVTGQRNDQRNNSYFNIDLKVTKDFALPKGIQMQVAGLVENLFNDGTYIIYNPDPGFKLGRQVNGVNEATSRFGRRYELSMRLAF